MYDLVDLDRYLFRDLLPPNLKKRVRVSFALFASISFELNGKTFGIYAEKSFTGGHACLCITYDAEVSVLTRDYWYRFSDTHNLLYTQMYREIDDWLEVLTDLDDIPVTGHRVFSMNETPWEAWFREHFVDTDIFDGLFYPELLSIQQRDRNLFKISYGMISSKPELLGWDTEGGLLVRPGRCEEVLGVPPSFATDRIRYASAHQVIQSHSMSFPPPKTP